MELGANNYGAYTYSASVDIYDQATDKLVKSYPLNGTGTGNKTGSVPKYGTSGRMYTAILFGIWLARDGFCGRIATTNIKK